MSAFSQFTQFWVFTASQQKPHFKADMQKARSYLAQNEGLPYSRGTGKRRRAAGRGQGVPAQLSAACPSHAVHEARPGRAAGHDPGKGQADPQQRHCQEHYLSEW